jgi:hypothetical protein
VLAAKAAHRLKPARPPHACRAGSIEVAPLLRGKCGGNYVPSDFDLSFEKTEDVVFFLLDRNEFGHGLASLRDHNGLALGLDFVHDGEAVDFEFTGRDGLHDHGHYTMVTKDRCIRGDVVRAITERKRMKNRLRVSVLHGLAVIAVLTSAIVRQAQKGEDKSYQALSYGQVL